MLAFKKLFLFLLCLMVCSGAYAKKSTVAQIGDYMQVIVPAYAFGMAMNENDYEGAKQFVYSFGAMEAAVYGLKYTVKEKRPNGADKRSFPSGHTAAAMSGASFIHRRYDLHRAFVPYMMTAFTAYSRIDSNKHWWWDTLAGAAISGAISWAIVKPYNGAQISVNPQGAQFKTVF